MGLAAVLVLCLEPPSRAQNQVWVEQFGTPEWDQPLTAAPAPDGVYVLGRTQGSLGGPNAGGMDVFLARHHSSGAQAWVVQLGTSAGEYGSGVAADGAGGVFAFGATDGSLGGPNAGESDAWLARFDGAGGRIWLVQFGTGARDDAGTAAPDGSGGAYVTGGTAGDLGGPNAGGEADAWLARYDDTGNRLWIRQLGTDSHDYGRGLAPDGSGGVFVAGYTGGSLAGQQQGNTDAWLARYDGAGNVLWALQLGTSAADVIRVAAPAGTDGVYVAGYTSGPLGGTHNGNSDPWVARYDGAGTQLWVRQFGTNASEDCYAVAPDGTGGVYLGVEGLTAMGQVMPASLTRFDGAGTQLWIRAPDVPSAPFAGIRATAPDGTGGVYVSGEARLNVWLGRYEPVCGPPAATARNAGSNPMSLQVTPPTVGASFTATVDLTTTGHAVAYLFAYDTPIDRALRGGQHLLCADGGAGLLFGCTVAGPLATFSIRIRNDASLCGLPFTMQAVHYGGVVPFALSNAQDLVIGF